MWDVRAGRDPRGHAEFIRGPERGRVCLVGQWQNQNPGLMTPGHCSLPFPTGQAGTFPQSYSYSKHLKLGGALIARWAAALGSPAFTSDHSQRGKSDPDPLHPPMAGGWRREGTDFPNSYPAGPRPPYSLFRHVLQLQVVHLQSSPQMQIPPRREDRATHVRTE